MADFLTFACIYSRGFINRENSRVITSLIGKWPFAAVSHTNQHFKEGNYAATRTGEVITFHLITVMTQKILYFYRAITIYLNLHSFP